MSRIADLKDGDRVFEQYMVKASDCLTSNAGKNYLSLTLQDSTGTISAKKWEVDPGDTEILAPGKVVSVEGAVLSYKGQLQMKILSVDTVDPTLVDYSRLLPVAPEDPKDMEKEVDGLLSSIRNEDLRKLAVALIDRHRNAYFSHPAAVTNHHAFLGGLAYHSLSMARLAEKVAALYPTLDRDFLVAGALVHDIGKTIELSGAVATRYTLEGKLLGHIVLLVGEIREEADRLGLSGETPVLLEHMVLSHHTKPEFGSPVPPLTKEAVVLGMIDDMDAKINMMDRILQSVEPGEWSTKQHALDERCLYRPLGREKDGE